VVIETALCMRPESFQWGGPIPVIGGAVSLETVDPELRSGMHRPAGLTEQGRHVARGAAPGPVEDLLPACGGGRVETSGRRRRGRNRELVELKRAKLRRQVILRAAYVVEAGAGGDGELRRVRQPRIEERPLPVHLEIGDERVPVRHAAQPV